MAQQASSDQSATAVKEVVVTGSRIPRPNLTSESPVTSVSAQEVKLSGTTDAVDLLNQYPQISYSYGNSPAALGGVAGISSVDLRGLGPERTLVLEDGKRLGPGDPFTPVPDIDNIPAALIDHVEVVTGGASAVYGSDALAGVVNFVMKKNFQGLQIDAQTSEYEDDNNNGLADHALSVARTGGLVGPIPASIPSTVWDGQTHQVTITVGANTADDKGNVTAWMSYRHADPVLESSRDYSACQISTTGQCTGSSISNLYIDLANSKLYSVSGNQFVPFGTAGLTPTFKYNSNPDFTFNRGDTRYNAGFDAHYTVAPWLDFYTNFNFMNDHSFVTASSSGLFTSRNYSVNCNNPELSAQQVQTICNGSTNGFAELEIGRRAIEDGPRVYADTHNTFRDVIGARGDLSDAWHYDVYGEYSATNAQNTVQNDMSVSRIANALQVVSGPNGPQCLSLATNPTCVPYNIFQSGGVTQAAINYVRQNSTDNGSTSEQVVGLDLTGKLGKYGIQSPWATEGVGVALGAEYRRESVNENPDEAALSGDLSAQGGSSPPTSGAYSTKEVYIELRVPVVQDKPFVKDLEIDGGYRRGDYSSIGSVESSKLSAEYAPTRDVRFRGSFQRAIRAPNVLELFSPATVSISNGTKDPCAGGGQGFGPNGGAQYSLAQCERLGVTAAEYGNGNSTNTILPCPAQQCGALVGGNPKLQAERSDTTDLGVVFTPTFVRNFTLSIDYFNVVINNAISVPLSSNQILSECALQDVQVYCDLVHRTANGFLFGNSIAGGGYVEQGLVNIGALQSTGFDVESTYRLPLSQLGLANLGAVNFSFNGTYTMHHTVTTPGIGTFDCAGLYGTSCGNPLPRWRHYARATWATPWKVDLSLAWRFYGGTKLDSNSSQPLLSNGGFDAFDARIPDFNYFDTTVVWHVRQNLRLRAGVQNIFDLRPPLLSASLTGNSTPGTYPVFDELGRNIFVGLTADF
jgi:outer membrane receptor protein involved in Fe transport